MIKLLTKGFSHGKGYYGCGYGLPSGYKIDLQQLKTTLKQRRYGAGRSARMGMEQDEVTILSGLDGDGKTNGAPFMFFIKNADNTLASKPKITALRSGHADLVGCVSLKKNDARIVCELASARRTVVYTAFGDVCKQILAQKGIYVYAFSTSIGGQKCDAKFDYFADYKAAIDSDVRCFNPISAAKMKQKIQTAIDQGDSIGGTVQVGCVGFPIGLGDLVDYDKKIDGILAQKMMSIPSVKGVSFGLGFKYATKSNSNVADKLKVKDDNIFYATNNCGGVVGGLSTGNDIVLNLAVKPIPTTKKGEQTVDLVTKQQVLSHYERSDVCVVPNVCVIAENILATALLDILIQNDLRIQFKKFNANDFDKNTLFVTDTTVKNLVDFKDYDVFVLPEGEKSKTLQTAVDLLTFMANKNYDKKLCIVAVGGGAVCDTAGFAATTYKRGLKLITVPTTLLCMVDAAIGGKNALNAGGAKNIIGSYNFPTGTIVDFDFLKTNSQHLIDEGFGEIVKTALLDEATFNLLDAGASMDQVVQQSLIFKQRIVNSDPYDDFLRRQLNLGHTLGHAIEILYNLPHGVAVLNGLYFETLMAYRLNLIDKAFCDKTTAFVLKYLNKPIDLSSQISNLIQLCQFDKKNLDDKICFVFVQPFFDYEFCYLTKQQTTNCLNSLSELTR